MIELEDKFVIICPCCSKELVVDVVFEFERDSKGDYLTAGIEITEVKLKGNGS